MHQNREKQETKFQTDISIIVRRKLCKQPWKPILRDNNENFQEFIMQTFNSPQMNENLL